MNARLPDLDSCATEPIRVPGAIQPHGRMLVLDAATGRELAWSANWPDPAQRRAALEALEGRFLGLVDGESPAPLGAVAVAGEHLDASAHRLGGQVIVEFEPAAVDRGTQAPLYCLARHFLPQLQRADSVDAVLRIAVRELKRLTGFGRCLAYRFDREGHGEVLAEAMDEGYESYAGHRFPASDIPAQARALYCLNFMRLISDCDYAPVPLVSSDPALAPTAIDLSLAGLRSVSPVHLECMRNMGTRASMSVSIVVRGQLWGLVSCHDRDTRFLSFPVRAACEHLGRLLSLQIEAAGERAEVEQRHERRQLALQIVAQRADLDASLLGLVDEPGPMLRLARAAGVAVVLNDTCRSFGDVPAEAGILALAEWLRHRGDEVFETDRLRELWPAAADWGDAGAGVMAIAISRVHRHVILWFRPAVLQTITWAGQPYKEVRAEGRIQPRSSFASWKEELRGRSLPWTSAEAAAVTELRQSLVGIVLLRDVTTALESAAALLKAKEEAERANRAKDRFLAVLSHELRTPLLPIAAAAQTLQRNVAVPPELSELLPMIRRNVLLEARLIEDLLDLTAISAGKLSLRRAPVDMRKIIDVVVEMVQETVDEKQIDLAVRWNASRGIVDGDAARLQQVLWNLVRNAVKFTPAGGRIRIEVDDDGARLRLRCIDSGIGIDEGALGTIFSAFEQASDDIARQFGGLGLGLAIAQGLVLEHGGDLSATSDGPGRGATFTLRLDTVDAPDAVAAQPAVAAQDSAASRPVRMLLVEDNEDAACAMTMSLEFMGYVVTHAPDLRAAMVAGERDAFDVIVTDLGLPDGSGLALGPALSARAPLIALSGFGSAEDVARSMAAGFAAHLVKPTDPDDVHATVGKILMRAGPA